LPRRLPRDPPSPSWLALRGPSGQLLLGAMVGPAVGIGLAFAPRSLASLARAAFPK
jgi:hypothetical protein